MDKQKKRYAELSASGYWKSRRTVRRFTGQEVTDELLFSLIDKASKAPTTGGMQLYSVVVARQPSTLKALCGCHFNQPAATGAKVILTVVADFNRFSRWCELRGAKPGFDNFESLVAAMLDAAFFAQQLVTLMEAEGLGTCYLGTATYTASRIGEILRLPRLTVPVAAIAVGWPDEEGADAERLPTGALIHQETYGDYTTDRIEEIFAEKEALEANKAFVRDNGKPSLAHVFTEVRYPEANALTFGKDFYDYIKRQGFRFPEEND